MVETRTSTSARPGLQMGDGGVCGRMRLGGGLVDVGMVGLLQLAIGKWTLHTHTHIHTHYNSLSAVASNATTTWRTPEQESLAPRGSDIPPPAQSRVELHCTATFA